MLVAGHDKTRHIAVIGLRADVESHAKTAVLNHLYQNVGHRGTLRVVTCVLQTDHLKGLLLDRFQHFRASSKAFSTQGQVDVLVPSQRL